MNRPAWPRNAPFAICLTHDIDHLDRYLYQRLWHAWIGGLSILWREWNDYCETFRHLHSAWNFEKLMKVEADHGARSTFLFLQESARGFGPRYWGRYSINKPEVVTLMHTLHAGGWEVALHGSLESWASEELFAREKASLESTLGVPVVSTRQHYLRYDPARTAAIHAQCGIRADSTYGYAHKPYDGKYGYMPFTITPHALVEVPITIMDTVGLENGKVRSYCMSLVHNIAEQGGLISLDWHQCSYNSIVYPERTAFYNEVLRFGAENGAWFATMRDVAMHVNGEKVPDGRM